MNYIEYIERTDANNGSVTWTCPKTGKWKVICVGGGASGALFVAPAYQEYVNTSGLFAGITTSALNKTSYTAPVLFNRFSKNLQEPGEVTSFGDVLSVSGGQIYTNQNTRSYIRSGGYGGYTVANGMCGNPATESIDSQQTVAVCDKNGGELEKAGIGYGAGGGSKVNIGLANTVGRTSNATESTGPYIKIVNTESSSGTIEYLTSYNGTLNFHSILTDICAPSTSDSSSSYYRYQRAYPFTCAGGYAGELSVNITELTKGAAVQCTIGAGGAVSNLQNLIENYLTTIQNKLRYSGTEYSEHPYTSCSATVYIDGFPDGTVNTSGVFNSYGSDYAYAINSLITPGNDGVIILQYLGE